MENSLWFLRLNRMGYCQRYYFLPTRNSGLGGEVDKAWFQDNFWEKIYE